MSFTASTRTPQRSTIVALCVIAALLMPLMAFGIMTPPVTMAQSVALGPQPGEVFRDFAYTNRITLCNRPSNQASCNGVPVERSQQITLDPTGATRAELVTEYWGGHIGSPQRWRVNGPSSVPIDQYIPFGTIAGTPTGSGTLPTHCYFRTLLGGISPIDVGQLVNGSNRFRFNIYNQFGQDTACRNDFGWGNTYIYSFIARVYYNPATTTRPTGSITSPNGGTVGEMPTVTVQASAPSGRTIVSVDVIGNYRDYDWDGDGVLQEWQYQLDRTVMKRHIGAAALVSGNATNGNYQAVWDTTWVPDQSQAVQIMAKITDSAGVSYMTPAVSVTFDRGARSVRLYTSTHTIGSDPTRLFGVRDGFQSRSGDPAETTFLTINDSLAGATGSRLMVSTWSGDLEGTHSEQIFVNAYQIPTPIGAIETWSFDWRDIPVGSLIQGDNIFSSSSSRPNKHALEYNWPGPALFVEWAGTTLARDTKVFVAEDTSLSITMTGASPDADPLAIARTTNPSNGNVSGSGATVTYTPQTNFNGNDSFNFQVSNTLGSDTGTVYLVVTPVNDAPVLNTAGNPTLPTIIEDVADVDNTGITVAGLLGDSVSDIDPNPIEGLAVVGYTGSGNWQYSLNGGTSWVTMPALAVNNALALNPDARIRFQPTLNANGVATISYRAWDQTDGYASGTVGINVNSGSSVTSAYSIAAQTEIASVTITPVNDPPTLTISQAQINLNILGLLSRTGIFSDIEGGAITVEADYGDGSGFQSVTPTGNSFILSHTYNSGGNFTVTVRLTDADGGIVTRTIPVTVTNPPPQVTIVSPPTVRQGLPYNATGSFSDAELGSWTATVDYGDGGGQQPLTLNPDQTFTLSHVYGNIAEYTVTVRVTDIGGVVGTSTVKVWVTNDPPVVGSVANVGTSLGVPFTRVITASDPNGDALTATVNYDDGAGPQPLPRNPDGSFTVSHSYSVSGTYTVTVVVNDGKGNLVTRTFTVVVGTRVYTPYILK